MFKRAIGWLGLGFAGAILSLLFLLSMLVGLITAMENTGSGEGSGTSGICDVTATSFSSTFPPTFSAAPGLTPTLIGTTGCMPPTQVAAAVVALARQMADALDVNPACGGIMSYPDCYYTWYNSTFPASVITYGNAVCPGCAAWANGNYQCVSFVRGVYGPIYPMQWTANAFDLWLLYQEKPGWQEIPAAAAPPGQRGMPLPGDVMVFADSSIGHVAIVMSVTPPNEGQNGSVTFANANSVSPYTTMPLLPDLTVDASSWPGYIVWGYIRPALPTTVTPT
jgi:CHAP domain